MNIAGIIEKIAAAPYNNSINNPTAEAIREICTPFSEEIKTDKLGNLICTVKKGGGRRAVLSAHMDKIGLIVTGIDKETGLVRFSRAGGTDVRILPASRIKLQGKELLRGTVCSTPPHLSKGGKEAAPAEELYGDFGKSFEELSSVVSPGDIINYDGEFIRLSDKIYSSPYMDNSAGCAAVIKAAYDLYNSDFIGSLELIFTVGEEIKGSGAAAAGFSADCDILLLTDVSFGSYPGVPPEKSSSLGSGTMIMVSPVLQKSVSDKLIETAEKNGIPYVREIAGRSTGTDGDIFVNSGAGIKTGLCSIPVKNMHTPAETLDIEDAENTARLFTAFIKEYCNA